jgi:hypothetical protein
MVFIHESNPSSAPIHILNLFHFWFQIRDVIGMERRDFTPPPHHAAVRSDSALHDSARSQTSVPITQQI